MRSFSNIMTNFAGNLHLLVDSIVGNVDVLPQFIHVGMLEYFL